MSNFIDCINEEQITCPYCGWAVLTRCSGPYCEYYFRCKECKRKFKYELKEVYSTYKKED